MQRLRATDKVHLAALALITCIGAAIRLQFAGGDMRYDESFWFMGTARRPIAQIVSDYSLPGNHIFHSLLQHIVTGWFGDGPVAIRLVALVCGIAVIPATYWAASVIYDADVGLVAAALAAVAGALVEYSVNARGYTLIVLFTLLLIPVGLRAIEQPRDGLWTLYAVLGGLGLWAVPTMIYGFAIASAWLFLVVVLDRRERRLRDALAGLALAVAGAFVLALICYLPTLGQGGWDYRTGTPFHLRFVAHGLVAGFGWLRWILVAGIVAAVVLHRRVSPRRSPLWLAMIMTVPPVALLSPEVPPFMRSWLCVLPFLLIVAAAGFVATARALRRGLRVPRAAAAAGVLIAVAFGLALNESDLPQSEDAPAKSARAVAAWLAAHAQRTDTISVNLPARPALIYELHRRGREIQAAPDDGTVAQLAETPTPQPPAWLVSIDSRGPVPAKYVTGPVVFRTKNARIYKLRSS